MTSKIVHSPLMFVHIQKCAGLSLQRKIRTIYGPGVFDRIFRMSPLNETASYRRTLQRYGYAMGHYAYGLERHIGLNLVKPKYITLLRDPVARLTSLYRYSRDHTDAYYHRFAQNGPADFFLRSGLLEMDNGMVRYLLQSSRIFINDVPVGKIGEDEYLQAVNNLRQFLLVGIVESFDKFIFLLGKKLGWKSSKYLRINESSGCRNSDHLDLGLGEELHQSNTWDQALYDLFSREFEERFKAEVRQIEYEQFLRQNAQYQARLAPIHHAKEKLVRRVRPR